MNNTDYKNLFDEAEAKLNELGYHRMPHMETLEDGNTVFTTKWMTVAEYHNEPTNA